MKMKGLVTAHPSVQWLYPDLLVMTAGHSLITVF